MGTSGRNGRINKVEVSDVCYCCPCSALIVFDELQEMHLSALHTLGSRPTTPTLAVWSRHQCVTVAQIHTGTLLASYLHCIGQQDSPTVTVHKTRQSTWYWSAQYVQIRQEMWPNQPPVQISDPRFYWICLKRIGTVTHPLTGNERERRPSGL